MGGDVLQNQSEGVGLVVGRMRIADKELSGSNNNNSGVSKEEETPEYALSVCVVLCYGITPLTD